MLVDDSRTMRSIVRQILERIGNVAIEEAVSGVPSPRNHYR